MSVETGVFTILSTSVELAAAAGVSLTGLPALVLRSGAVVNPPDRWVAIRWQEPMLTGRMVRPSFTLHAHDRDQTYDWATACLDAARQALTAVVHQQGITQVDWMGRSPDLADDGYRTLTRFDTYVVAARQNTGRT